MAAIPVGYFGVLNGFDVFRGVGRTFKRGVMS